MTIFIENRLQTETFPLENQEVTFSTLIFGYYFGETDLLFAENKERTYNTKASKKAELLALSKEGFESMLKMFEDEATEIMNLAYRRDLRIKENQTEAIDVFINSKAVRRLISLPQFNDLEFEQVGKITVIPPQDNAGVKPKNMFNLIVDENPNKVESDIDWITKKVRKLKSVVSETKENLCKICEALM